MQRFSHDGGLTKAMVIAGTLYAALVPPHESSLATGMCLLPEQLIMAKQVATIDRLAGGRFVFGVGI
jgi:hypothetical protein